MTAPLHPARKAVTPDATLAFEQAHNLAAMRLEALRAAGEATRLRLLHLLAHEELSVMELVDILEQSQPRISRHLKLLADAGLIERFPEGAFVYYRLSHDHRFAALTHEIVSGLDEDLAPDLTRLEEVRNKRRAAAQGYFEDIAPVWDKIRSLYVSEMAVEAAILETLGAEPYNRLVDLGTGSGRMLTLLGPKAHQATGLDLSQRMLTIARVHVEEAGLRRVDLRHGDIYDTRLQAGVSDLVIIHQVLHFLDHPELALIEAARILKVGGRLLIVDFAPHSLEAMMDIYKHRRLGVTDADMQAWSEMAGLRALSDVILPSSDPSKGLSVRIWLFQKP